MYAERQDFKNSLICAQELEDRYLRIYDKNSPQMVWIYHHLCTLHYANSEFKDALNYAQLRLAIISKVTSPYKAIQDYTSSQSRRSQKNCKSDNGGIQRKSG
jgi:hypothetical protein